MIEHIKASLQDAHRALGELLANETTLRQIEAAGQTLIQTFENDGRVFACGNGGSMCDAMHFAEELTGRYRKDRKAYPAIAISDPSHMTCVANDMGYDAVFARYVEAHARASDSLVAISTSGTSPNIINAAKAAKAQGVKVIAMTGRADSPLEQLADVSVCTAAGPYADRVQELHIKVLHILIETVERHFHPENY